MGFCDVIVVVAGGWWAGWVDGPKGCGLVMSQVIGVGVLFAFDRHPVKGSKIPTNLSVTDTLTNDTPLASNH